MLDGTPLIKNKTQSSFAKRINIYRTLTTTLRGDTFTSGVTTFGRWVKAKTYPFVGIRKTLLKVFFL